MKKIQNRVKNVCVILLFSTFAISCSTDESDKDGIPDTDALTAQEVQLLLESDELVSAADQVLSQLFLNNDTSGKTGSTNECYAAEYTETGYSVTFNNCVLNGTDNVNGSLIVTYAVNSESASYTVTYNDFYVNEAVLNGSRTILLLGATVENALSYTVNSTMDLVLANGTNVSENGERIFGFTIGENIEDIAITLDGNWNLTVGSDVYAINVINELQTKVGCTYIAEGSIGITKNGLALTLDFGDGTCDDKATITYPNGTTEEVTLRD
ncbi:hypothetical protein ACFQZJ_09195 [Maribacter chungangensis]|uniref:Lipoprotein n=1 Tax=Maribacter chungangensis TaxID=1069117 RepID=A0ABW3B3I0_9FLAO